MASLKLASLTKQYPKNPQPTLDGLDLDIHDGEFLVLVGPSGCGKSTLLRTIAGLESITRGDLWIGEQKVNQLRPRDRDIAMVFQSYALYPHMTVRRNMAFGLEVRKMPRDEIHRRVGEAAQILGLEAHLDKLPRALSGGQRQRVAMGRAIVREPKVFLFDEPLSNLDASLRNQMRVEIKKLHTQLATTMIYVTHDQVEAMTLADRIAVLDRGHLQQVSPPLELFYQPANRFVAGFIGHPSMNTFEGTLRHHGGEWSVQLAASHTLALVPPSEHRLEANMRVAVGVRPQSVRLASAEQRESALRAKVDVIETLGWESHIHAHVGPETLLAAVSSQEAWPLKAGDDVWLNVPADALYVFSAEHGHALFQRPIDSAQHVAWPVEASA